MALRLYIRQPWEIDPGRAQPAPKGSSPSDVSTWSTRVPVSSLASVSHQPSSSLLAPTPFQRQEEYELLSQNQYMTTCRRGGHGGEGVGCKTQQLDNLSSLLCWKEQATEIIPTGQNFTRKDWTLAWNQDTCACVCVCPRGVTGFHFENYTSTWTTLRASSRTETRLPAEGARKSSRTTAGMSVFIAMTRKWQPLVCLLSHCRETLKVSKGLVHFSAFVSGREHGRRQPVPWRGPLYFGRI